MPPWRNGLPQHHRRRSWWSSIQARRLGTEREGRHAAAALLYRSALPLERLIWGPLSASQASKAAGKYVGTVRPVLGTAWEKSLLWGVSCPWVLRDGFCSPKPPLGNYFPPQQARGTAFLQGVWPGIAGTQQHLGKPSAWTCTPQADQWHRLRSQCSTSPAPWCLGFTLPCLKCKLQRCLGGDVKFMKMLHVFHYGSWVCLLRCGKMSVFPQMDSLPFSQSFLPIYIH